MNRTTLNFVLTMVALIMMGVFTPFFIRSFIWNKFLKATNEKDEAKAKAILNGRAYRTMFPEYDRNWNLLRLAMATNNDKEVEELINTILYSKASKTQKFEACSASYYYYLDKENKEMCTKLLERVDELGNDDGKKDMHMLYRVLIEKKAEDIDYILAKMETNKDELNDVRNKIQLGLLQYYLGLQYSYKNDKKEAESWLNKAKENLKGTPYHKKIKAYTK